MNFNIIQIFFTNLFKINKIKLEKNNPYNNKNINKKNNLLLKIRKNKIITDLYKEYLIKFILTLISKNANFDFTIFKKNIKSLNIVITNRENEIWTAQYDNKKNIIYIQEEQLNLGLLEDNLYHELFHMLTSRNKHQIEYIGFQKNGVFGKGINEGYTQVLCKRYFNLETGGYQVEEIISRSLEYIVSKSLMENFYSKAKFNELISEIAKYNNDINETYRLLSDIDILLKLNPLLYQDTIISIHEFIRRLKITLIEIIELFINKKVIDKNNDDIEEFFKNISFGIRTPSGDYRVFEKEEIEKYKNHCYQITKQKEHYF